MTMSMDEVSLRATVAAMIAVEGPVATLRVLSDAIGRSARLNGAAVCERYYMY